MLVLTCFDDMKKYFDEKSKTYDFSDYDTVCFEFDVNFEGRSGKIIANNINATHFDVGMCIVNCSETITAKYIGSGDLSAETIDAGRLGIGGDVHAGTIKADFAHIDYTLSAINIDIKMIDASEIMCFGDMKATRIDIRNVCFAEKSLSIVFPYGYDNSIVFCRDGDLTIAGNKMDTKYIIIGKELDKTEEMLKVEEDAEKYLEETVFEKYFTKEGDSYVYII